MNINSLPVQSAIVFITVNSRYERVDVTEIRCIEAVGTSVRLYLSAQKVVKIGVNLSHFLSQIPQHFFIRVSRKHLVNIHHIEAIEGNYIFLESSQIRISRRLHPQVMEQIPIIRTRSVKEATHELNDKI